MLSVFGFDVFWGSTSAIFRVFVVLLLSGSVLGQMLCNRIFQNYGLTVGNLGCRNLLVFRGKCCPFSSGSFFKLLLALIPTLSTGYLEMSFGVTPQQLTRGTSSAASCCFSPSCPMNSHRNFTLGLRTALFGSFSRP